MFKRGRKYVANKQQWECLAIRGEYAWLVRFYGDAPRNPTAYVWRQDGTSVSLGEEYNVTFA